MLCKSSECCNCLPSRSLWRWNRTSNLSFRVWVRATCLLFDVPLHSLEDLFLADLVHTLWVTVNWGLWGAHWGTLTCFEWSWAGSSLYVVFIVFEKTSPIWWPVLVALPFKTISSTDTGWLWTNPFSFPSLIYLSVKWRNQTRWTLGYFSVLTFHY